MRLPLRITHFRALTAAVSASLMLLSVACSDDGGVGKRYPVTGKVTYKGAPVEKGVINFVPTTGDGRGAAGQIVNGAFTMTTLHPDDGALPGKYKVTIDTRQLDNSKLEAQAKEQAAKKGVANGYSMIPQDLQAKALKEAKGVVPGKYQLAETSDLEAEVKAQANTFTFDLKD